MSASKEDIQTLQQQKFKEQLEDIQKLIKDEISEIEKKITQSNNTYLGRDTKNLKQQLKDANERLESISRNAKEIVATMGGRQEAELLPEENVHRLQEQELSSDDSLDISSDDPSEMLGAKVIASVSKENAQTLQQQKFKEQLEDTKNSIKDEINNINKELKRLGKVADVIDVSKEKKRLEQQLTDDELRLKNLHSNAEKMMGEMEGEQEAELQLGKDAHRLQEQEQPSDDFLDIDLDDASEIEDRAQATKNRVMATIQQAFEEISKSFKESLAANKQEKTEPTKHTQNAEAADDHDNESPSMRR